MKYKFRYCFFHFRLSVRDRQKAERAQQQVLIDRDRQAEARGLNGVAQPYYGYDVSNEDGNFDQVCIYSLWKFRNITKILSTK